MTVRVSPALEEATVPTSSMTTYVNVKVTLVIKVGVIKVFEHYKYNSHAVINHLIV